MNYLYNLEPFAHQNTAMELSMDRQYFALFMDMGTGKSKIVVDTAMHLYGAGRIDTVVVVAPNGVHRNWVLNEIPTHMHPSIEWAAAYYAANARKQERESWDNVKASAGKLRWFCFNIEAASNKKGQTELERLVKLGNVLFVVDESHGIKTPGVKRTRFIVNLAKHAAYRRILTGTPLTQSPLDFYSQLRFLDTEITGYKTFTAFRAHYAVMERRRTNNNKRGYFDLVVGYQNISELERQVAPHCYRVRKEDCLDLPDKMYEKVYVPITTEQRRLYNQLVDESVAVLTEEYDGEIPQELLHVDKEQLLLFFADKKLTAKNAMVKLLRLQQVLCGYLPTDEDKKTLTMIESKRLTVLMDTVEGITGKVIIWARFKQDLWEIPTSLRQTYGSNSVAEFHGSVDTTTRMDGVKRFQEDPGCRFFVAQQHSGGTGLTLTAATYVIYYSNDYSLSARLQSEDRAHRIGQKQNVTYIDLVCDGTVDEKILDSLQEKKAMADNFNYEGEA